MNKLIGIFTLLSLLATGCSSQSAPPSAAIAQQQASTVQLMRVQPVATTASGQIAQAVEPADCAILGMTTPQLFATSAPGMVSAINPFIGALFSKFFCTVVKGWLSPPAETIAVQTPTPTSTPTAAASR